MNNAIFKEAQRRGITRLCHFTPSRNLVHIVSGQTGILATAKLKNEERSIFTPTDLERFDKHERYICCSIQYPNAWYFDIARNKDVIFKDWVILLIDPKYIWAEGTLFCQRNAAASYGTAVAEGEAQFVSLFADIVRGAHGKSYRRLSTRLKCCTTDEQAEVMVPDEIKIEDIQGIVIPTESQAKNEAARFRQLGVEPTSFPLIVAPTLFEKLTLSQCIQSGKYPVEKQWVSGE